MIKQDVIFYEQTHTLPGPYGEHSCYMSIVGQSSMNSLLQIQFSFYDVWCCTYLPISLPLGFNAEDWQQTNSKHIQIELMLMIKTSLATLSTEFV